MIQSVKSYLYDRRRGLAKTAGVVGGTFLIGRYVMERLEEAKEKVMQERSARDGLRRRFAQNQDNVSFTIMAHTPTLGKQILEQLDVESVTQELQTKSSSVEVLYGTKSKAELWREVKMLTVTRTLTIVYSMTLLALFTNIQLTLLARSKYIYSILQQERDERLREQLEFGASVSSMFWGAVGNLLDPESLAGDEEEEGEINEEIEVKYLTLSWWMLHVGWKDVAERVRRGVEEVFEGVSLKTKLGALELHRLISDVRRRVEHEVTLEGDERRVNFLSNLLPPTAETLQHALIQGGMPSYLSTHHDPIFTTLLDETRLLMASSDFECVLELELDRATEVLFDGLQKNVFVDHNSSPDESQDIFRLRLAGLLPGLARWSHLALNGLPNELVDNLTGMREMAGFSAIIFSTFDDRCR